MTLVFTLVKSSVSVAGTGPTEKKTLMQDNLKEANRTLFGKKQTDEDAEPDPRLGFEVYVVKRTVNAGLG